MEGTTGPSCGHRGTALSSAPGAAGSSGTPHTQAHSPQRKATPFQGSQLRECRGSEETEDSLRETEPLEDADANSNFN